MVSPMVVYADQPLAAGLQPIVVVFESMSIRDF